MNPVEPKGYFFYSRPNAQVRMICQLPKSLKGRLLGRKADGTWENLRKAESGDWAELRAMVENEPITAEPELLCVNSPS